MLKLQRTNAFKRDFKSAIIEVFYLLLNDEPLPPKYKNHELIGNYKGFSKCHIKPDLLLIYQKDDECLSLVRLGSYSELF